MSLPHDAEDTRWTHLRSSSWSRYSGPGRPACDTPGVHLARPGSDGCISGFRSLREARLYREIHDLDHRVVDLRDDRPQLTRPELHAARRAELERICETHDFGAFRVADWSGWEHDGRNRFERTVFLDPGHGDSIAQPFAVEFPEGQARGATIDFTPPDAEEPGPEMGP